MNRSEIISATAAKAGTSRANTAPIIDALLEVIIDGVASGDEVNFIGFGKFNLSCKNSPASIGDKMNCDY